MLNEQHIKLGVIGFGIVAISLGIGIGVSTMNKNSGAINAAKSMSTEDLPWCPEVTRKLVVPGINGSDNVGGMDRKLGLILTSEDTPNPKTPMPTSDDFFNPPVSTPLSTNPPVTFPTKTPLSTFKPSAAAVVSASYHHHDLYFLPSVCLHPFKIHLTHVDTFLHCNIIAGV